MDDETRKRIEDLEMRLEQCEILLLLEEDELDPLEAQHRAYVARVRAQREV